MKIKLLCAAPGLAALAGLLASAGASQEAVPGRYAVLRDSPGVSTLALREAIDPLFAQDGKGAGVGETRALIVLRHGEIVAERYGDGFGPQSRLLSWSIARTVTGLLVGIMVSDGRMALDDPAPVAAWRQPGDPRAAITLRQLLQMRSGLLNRERWEPGAHSDALDMLVGEGAGDQAAFAIAKPLVHPVGETFEESSATAMILAGLIGDQLGAGRDPRARREAMARFLAARFAGPLGLTGFTPEYDESGTLQGAVMMHMTARDYARLGELILHRGKAGGRQLVSDKWFDFMLAPSPANAAYGGQLWLNRASGTSALFPGEARASLVGAVGQRGQYLLVSPEQGLTIVRLGVTREEQMGALKAAMARLVRRFPGA